MTSRRDLMRLAGGVVLGGAPALALAGTGARDTAISESFVFPEWSAAVAEALSASRDAGDRAFLLHGLAERRAPAPGAPAGRRLVLTLPAPGVELFAPAAAADLARLANDRLSAHVRASGGGLAGFASIAGASPGAAAEADRALGLPGITGLCLAANRGLRLDDRALWPVYETAQAAGAPLYLPASYAPTAGDLPYRARGAAGILAGASAESAAHARQLIFGGVLDAFPTLQVVLGRLGEATPYWYSDLVAIHDMAEGPGSRPVRHIDDYFRDNLLVTSADVTSAEVAFFASSVLGARRVVASPDQPSRLDYARGRLDRSV